MSRYQTPYRDPSFTNFVELLRRRPAQILLSEVTDDDLDDNVPPLAKTRPFIRTSVLEVWLRSLSLGMLWNAFRGTSQPSLERPKRAVNRGLTTAAISVTAAHLLPVAAAIALVILNIHGYYIGGELAGPSGDYDDVKLSALQFTSKLHEVTMQGSLCVIVVGLIREELVAGEGIPFGAVFGSLQFTNLSYLYSKEFMGTIRAKFRNRLVKARLIGLLFVGSILAFTVGPSSAIAMRPRLDNWPAGGSDFYLNATHDQMWPSSLNDSHIATSCKNISVGTTCLSGGWESIMDQYLGYWPGLTDDATMPHSLQLNGPESVRSMYTQQTTGLYTFFETAATTQMSNLADSLAEVGRLWSIAAAGLSDVSPNQQRRFIYRKDATYTLNDVYQPVTAARCLAHRGQTQLQEILQKNVISIPIVSSLCDKTSLEASFSIPPETSAMISQHVYNNLSLPSLVFVELPDQQFGNNTIGAFITFPPSWPSGANIITCAVDARWVPVSLECTRDVLKIVTGRPTDWPGVGTCRPSSPSITVTPGWAEYLNPYIRDSNQTVFNTLLERVGTQTSRWSDDTGFVEGLIQSILATLVTSGLSRTSSSATIQGDLKGCSGDGCGGFCGLWCIDMMPKSNLEFGCGGNIYNLSSIPDLTKLSKFTVQVDVNGYAYNRRGSTMVLSCAVLICYCLLAATHAVFVLVERTSSNAWSTVSEVTALAMQSQPTELLKNTSAGISTTGIFSLLVRVVRTGANLDHLELSFDDSNTTHGERLVEDDFYS